MTFQLTVSDNRGGTDTDDVTIVINRAGVVANRAPTANAAPDG